MRCCKSSVLVTSRRYLARAAQLPQSHQTGGDPREPDAGASGEGEHEPPGPHAARRRRGYGESRLTALRAAAVPVLPWQRQTRPAAVEPGHRQIVDGNERHLRHDQWQQQTEAEQRAQQQVADARRRESNNGQQRECAANDDRRLHGMRDDIGGKECRAHSSTSFAMRRIIRRSSFERRPSLARCSSSGAAAPSKTRSRKSRTIAPTTRCRGCVGR